MSCISSKGVWEEFAEVVIFKDSIEDKQYQFLDHVDVMYCLLVRTAMKGILFHKSYVYRFQPKVLPLSNTWYDTLTFSAFSQVKSIDGVVLLSIDFWFTLSIAVAWRVSIDTSLVDLRIMHKPAGSFFEGPINPLFIVVPGTEMYVPEAEEKIL